MLLPEGGPVNYWVWAHKPIRGSLALELLVALCDRGPREAVCDPCSQGTCRGCINCRPGVLGTAADRRRLRGDRP